MGRERSQQQTLQAGLALDRLHGWTALAHGALSQDLAGEDEVIAALIHDLLRPLQHEDAAVDAWIHAERGDTVRQRAVSRKNQLPGSVT